MRVRRAILEQVLDSKVAWAATTGATSGVAANALLRGRDTVLGTHRLGLAGDGPGSGAPGEADCHAAYEMATRPEDEAAAELAVAWTKADAASSTPQMPGITRSRRVEALLLPVVVPKPGPAQDRPGCGRTC